MNEHEQYMQAAIAQSRISIESGNGATGCVIVKDGAILAEGHNEEFTRIDPTAHAEIVTIQRLCKKLGTRDLHGLTLYSTLQPCGMCTAACIWAGITTIVYGAERKDVASRLFDERHRDTADFVADAFRKDITVIPGVLERECSALYRI